MQKFSLLPYNGSKRTGVVYDDYPRYSARLDAKRIQLPGGKPSIIQIRLQTAEADWMWAEFGIRADTLGIEAAVVAMTERDAYARLAKQLHIKGFPI